MLREHLIHIFQQILEDNVTMAVASYEVTEVRTSLKLSR